MAITLVNSLNINTEDQTTDGSGNATLSLSGLTISNGDTLVIAFNSSATSDVTPTASGNNSGACAKEADGYSNDTRDTNLAVFIAKQGATPDTSISVASAGNSVRYCARILQYSGVDTTTPIDVATPAVATGTDGDDADPPSITPSTSGAKIVAIYAAVRAGGNSTWTAPANVSNWTEIQTNHSAGTGAEPILGTGDKDWTSGAFNPDAVTGGAGSTSNSWVGATIALRPAASSGAISGASTVAFTTSGALAGSGVLSGSASPAFTTTGALAGSGALSGATAPAFTTAGTLVGSGALSGAVETAFTLAGTMAGAGALSGTSDPAFTVSGALGGDGALSGASAPAFTTAGSLAGVGALSGASEALFTVAASLIGAGALTGVAAFAFDLTGSMPGLNASLWQIRIRRRRYAYGGTRERIGL